MFDKSKFESTKVDKVLNLTYEDRDAFTKGSGIPAKTMKEVYDYQHKYIEEATAMAAEVAKANLKKDKSIEKVVVNYPYSTKKDGKVDVTVFREREFRNNFGDKKGEIIRKPSISVAVDDPLTNVSKKKIHDLVDDLIAALNK